MTNINHNYDNYFGIEARMGKLPHLVDQSTLNQLGTYGGAGLVTNPGFGETAGLNSYMQTPNTGLTWNYTNPGFDPNSVNFNTQPSGAVLGDNTSNVMGGSTGGGTPPPDNNTGFQDSWLGAGGPYAGWGRNEAIADFNATGGSKIGGSSNEVAQREAQARSAIDSGYSAYFSQLDDMLNNGLPGQRTAQEGIAQSQYNQGVNTLGNQFQAGSAQLTNQRGQTEQQQGKTLRDIGENIRNSFLAGNIYLGSKGAGDSSAANQYSYALTQLGSKQRGDVQSQYANIFNDISTREQNLKSTYDTESKNLQETLNQQINSIAQWFGEQQNALKQAKANGQLQKGQDLATLSQNLLNVALQNLQTVQKQVADRKSALEEWAINNSTTINQLKANMQAVNDRPFAASPTAQPILGTPSVDQRGNYSVAAGYGNSKDSQKTDIFGNIIR